MELDPERLQRANAVLEAWVRDLLVENRLLRERLARGEGEEARDRLAARGGAASQPAGLAP